MEPRSAHQAFGSARAAEPPAAARRLFGDRLASARAYADWLVGPGVERGLIGPREVSRIWDRHLLNCAVVSDLVPPGARVADVGSGAGLPGLVLAIVRSDLHLTLVESLARRVEFLDEVVAALGLGQVEVVRERAENLQEGRFDVVTARAVAPLERLLGWSLPLVRPGGRVLAIKGAQAEAELAAAASVLRRWPNATAEVRTVGTGVVEPPTTVVEVRR